MRRVTGEGSERRGGPGRRDLRWRRPQRGHVLSVDDEAQRERDGVQSGAHPTPEPPRGDAPISSSPPRRSLPRQPRFPIWSVPLWLGGPSVADDAIAQAPPATFERALRAEFGPFTRWVAETFFPPVRCTPQTLATLKGLSDRGFVVHVMRTTAWINFLYLAWLMVRHGLPAVRAVVNLRPWFTRPWTKCDLPATSASASAPRRSSGASGLIFLRESAFNSARGVGDAARPLPCPGGAGQEVGPARLPRARALPLGEVAAEADPERLRSRLRQPRGARLPATRSARSIATTSAPSSASVSRSISSTSSPRTPTRRPRCWRARCAPPSPTTSPARRAPCTARRASRPSASSTRRCATRVFQQALAEAAQEKSRSLESVQREARRNLRAIAAKYSPTVTALAPKSLDSIFNRIYDGVEVDEAGPRARHEGGVARAGGLHPEPQEPRRLPGDELRALQAQLPGAAGGRRREPLLLPPGLGAPAGGRLLPPPLLQGATRSTPPASRPT